MFYLSKRILFQLLIISTLFSCSNVKEEAVQENESLALSDSDLKELVFAKLKNSEFEAADSISNLVLDESDSFYLLMKAISTVGVDSLSQASKEFQLLQEKESNECYNIITEEFLQFLADKKVERSYRKIHLENVMKELEPNNVVNLCELFQTLSTYVVEVE